MEEEQTELFDIIIPPGVPRSIIMDVMETFKNVELVNRPQKLYFANMEGDNRELLAFRGERETIEEVEKYMLKKLDEFVNE